MIQKLLRMRQNKKSKCLTLSAKMEIIEKHKKGSSVTFLAKKYGVAKSTICSIKNKEEQIAATLSSTFNGPGKRKTLRKGELPNTEASLYKWFLRQRSKHLPVNSILMKEMALKLYKKHEGRNGGLFNASDGCKTPNKIWNSFTQDKR